MTHSRNNNNNFNQHNKGANKKHNNNSNQSGGGFAGSGDGGIDDIRGENDDDEDNRFGLHSVKIPTTNSQPPPVDGKDKDAVGHKGGDDDFKIDEDEKAEEDLDGDEDEDEDEDEDLDEDEEEAGQDVGAGEDDLGLDFNIHKQKPAVNPITTDDEDLESQCMAFFTPFYRFDLTFDLILILIISFIATSECATIMDNKRGRSVN